MLTTCRSEPLHYDGLGASNIFEARDLLIISELDQVLVHARRSGRLGRQPASLPEVDRERVDATISDPELELAVAVEVGHVDGPSAILDELLAALERCYRRAYGGGVA